MAPTRALRSARPMRRGPKHRTPSRSSRARNPSRSCARPADGRRASCDMRPCMAPAKRSPERYQISSRLRSMVSDRSPQGTVWTSTTTSTSPTWSTRRCWPCDGQPRACSTSDRGSGRRRSTSHGPAGGLPGQMSSLCPFAGPSRDVGSRSSVLLVDDDRDLLNLLAFLVEQAGLTPLLASDPTTALDLFTKEDPSVAIIDLNLTPWDGFELLEEVRRRSPSIPILVLTARASEDDKVRALDTGADDYVVKHVVDGELVARIRAHVRRGASARNGKLPHATLEVGPLRLDLRERLLEITGEEELRLTGTEFRLLEYLMRNSNAVVPTAALAQHVWGYDDAPARDVVRVTVHRLRKKLRDDGGDRRFIETGPGRGPTLRLTVNRRETKPTV